MLRIPHQFINSAIKRFFSKLNRCYAFITKFYGCISLTLNAFFSILIFFHGYWQLTGQQEKGGYLLLLHSSTCIRSRTFRHLFATLHMRWLSHTFSLHCLYLPDYYTMRFTTLSSYYLIGWWCDVNFCLFTCWFDFTFCHSYMTWEKPVDSNSCRISFLYYNQTDK